eukprot:scaffold194265_cov33-Tisochrysis_lutea.AAC.4
MRGGAPKCTRVSRTCRTCERPVKGHAIGAGPRPKGEKGASSICQRSPKCPGPKTFQTTHDFHLLRVPSDPRCELSVRPSTRPTLTIAEVGLRVDQSSAYQSPDGAAALLDRLPALA